MGCFGGIQIYRMDLFNIGSFSTMTHRRLTDYIYVSTIRGIICEGICRFFLFLLSSRYLKSYFPLQRIPSVDTGRIRYHGRNLLPWNIVLLLKAMPRAMRSKYFKVPQQIQWNRLCLIVQQSSTEWNIEIDALPGSLLLQSGNKLFP